MWKRIQNWQRKNQLKRQIKRAIGAENTKNSFKPFAVRSKCNNIWPKVRYFISDSIISHSLSYNQIFVSFFFFKWLGGKLSDLPPPPVSENPDYVKCPHCSRSFNESAAARHIPKCANFQFNKPKPSGKSKPVYGRKRTWAHHTLIWKLSALMWCRKQKKILLTITIYY